MEVKTFKKNIPNSIKPRDVFKRFLLFFGPALAVFGGIVFSIYTFERLNLRDNLIVRERMILGMAAQTVRDHLEGAVSDLWYLAELPDIRASLSNKEKFFNPLLADLLKFSLRTRKYDELRLWDGKGEKGVRIFYGGGISLVGQKETFGSKIRDPLWSKIAALNAGEIFISSSQSGEDPGERADFFNICIGTPVRGKDNELKGVLIFYYGGRDILDHFETWGFGSRKIIMLNSRGLTLNDLEGRRGEERPESENEPQMIAGKKSDIWTRISGEEEGQILAKGGLYNFATIYPGWPDRRSFLERDSCGPLFRFPFSWSLCS